MNKQTVLITGSTSGIGLAIAKAFAKHGCNIIFNGLEDDGYEIARSVCNSLDIDFIFNGANMCEPASLYGMVEEAHARFGSIDVLVNNAGVQYVSAIEEFPADKWDDIIAINLTAAFHLTKAVWPYMKMKKQGRIINIASVHGLYASPFKSAYIAAKHGLIGLTKTAALEGAGLRITCNAICPGYVQSQLVQQQVAAHAAIHNISEDEVVEKTLLAKHAIKDFIPASTIGELCVFLASEAAAMITGTAIPVDAGWSAQ